MIVDITDTAHTKTLVALNSQRSDVLYGLNLRSYRTSDLCESANSAEGDY